MYPKEVKDNMKKFVQEHRFGHLKSEEIKTLGETNGVFMKGCHSKYDLLKRIESALRSERDWFIIANDGKGKFKSNYPNLL